MSHFLIHITPTHLLSFIIILTRTPRSPLFPYTTLFRSANRLAVQEIVEGVLQVTLSGLRFLRSFDHLIIDGAQKPDRKSTRLNSSHRTISYAVFCLKKKKDKHNNTDVWSTVTSTHSY